jgi:hypothetical protein
MCARALETCMPTYTGRFASLFFMLETCGPQGALGHVAVPEPAPAGRRGLETHDKWQCRSPPQPGGVVRSHMTCSSVRAHPSREARSVDI